MNIYHTRSKIKSKRHQSTKNRETSALQLRKTSWLTTKKKDTLKFCISRKRHMKGAACFFTFQLPWVHGPSGRESIQDKTSRWGHHCTENPEKKKAAVKLQLLSSKVLGRLLLLTFLFPPPLAQYWAKRLCLCAWLLCYIPTMNREAREIFSKRENSLFWGLTFRNTFVRECRSKRYEHSRAGTA